jgi:PadR family transcriptional regulator PadR
MGSESFRTIRLRQTSVRLETSRRVVDFRQYPMVVLSKVDNTGTSETTMAREQSDLLRGTLDLLILRSLAGASMHGWALSQSIQHQSENLLRVGQGSLYPALQRLEQQGWIESEWRTTDQNRPAKYYTLTASGRRALTTETKNWRQYVRAVDLILGGS